MSTHCRNDTDGQDPIGSSADDAVRAENQNVSLWSKMLCVGIWNVQSMKRPDQVTATD